METTFVALIKPLLEYIEKNGASIDKTSGSRTFKFGVRVMVGWVASELFPVIGNTFPTTFLQTVRATLVAHGFPVILYSIFRPSYLP